jgi:opacity protein-like surface antigen
MKKTALSLVAIIATTPAFAGGVVATAERPAAPIAVSDPAPTDWTGFYGGLQLETFASGGLSVPAAGASVDMEGTVGGIFAGYRHDLGSYVVGAELDYMVGTAGYDLPGSAGFPDFDVTLARFGGEVGYDFGRFLVSGAAGYANITLELGSASESLDGFYYGLGADYRLTDQITLGGELLRHEFDLDNTGATAGTEFDLTTFGINVAYNF